MAEGEENCDGESLGPVGTVCFLRCKSGYIFSETTADVVIARCSELQKWTFDGKIFVLHKNVYKPCLLKISFLISIMLDYFNFIALICFILACVIFIR